MKHFRVLVVDDEIEFLDVITRRMKKRGIECEGLDNGPGAIEKIQTENFDVVLLDLKMPDMDGIATLREIKRVKPLVEVVILTGHASVKSGIEGMKLGAYDYLMKPMELDPLLEKLKEAYEKKTIQEEKIQKAEFVENLRFHRGLFK
jgi:DNA-binding NtrC family response regulator